MVFKMVIIKFFWLDDARFRVLLLSCLLLLILPKNGKAFTVAGTDRSFSLAHPKAAFSAREVPLISKRFHFGLSSSRSTYNHNNNNKNRSNEKDENLPYNNRNRRQYSKPRQMQQQTTRENSKFSTTGAPLSLNKELFKLRGSKNGLSMAENRLDSAVEFLLQNENKAKEVLLNTKRNNRNNNNNNKIYNGNNKEEKANLEFLQQLPDEISFNRLLSSYAKYAQDDWSAPQKAEQLLRRMQDLSRTFPHLTPTVFSFNSVMEAYSKRISGKTNNERRNQQCRLAILRLFQEMKQATPVLEPDSYTYSLVLSANAPFSEDWCLLEKWALDFLSVDRANIAGNGDAVELANVQDTNISSILPERQTYNQLLKCYAEGGDADEAEQLIDKIIESHGIISKKYDIDLQPNSVWFNLVFRALLNSQNSDDFHHPSNEGSQDQFFSPGDRADALLEKMYDLTKAGYEKIRPDTATYNHVLNVHAHSGNTQRAEELVAELEKLYYATNESKELRPDVITYTTLIKAYSARQQQSESEDNLMSIAMNATKVFRKMQALSDEGWPYMSPSLITYNTLLNIWTNCYSREAMEMAMEILSEMNDDRKNPPDSVTYTILIHGWSRGDRHLSRLPEAGYQAEQLLVELEQLPQHRIRANFLRSTVYNSVITAWSKSADKNAAQRVDALLQQLEGKYFNGDTTAQPTKTTFLCMIDAYAKAKIPDAEERCEALLQRMLHFRDVFQLPDLEPDRAVYNAVLNALAKSRQESAVEKAEEILTMMQTSPDEELRPDIVTYATVIDCYTKCGEGSQRADELLRFVEGSYRGGDTLLEPNAVFYSAILQAYAKTATDEGARKAERLLRRNLALYEEGYAYAKPHGIMYNAVMDAIARTGEKNAGGRAEELLHEMESLYQAGNLEMKPSRRSFNAVILAYRNEGDGGKKAEEVLMRMERLADSGFYDLSPDVVSYNCVIGAIVDSEQPDAANRAQALLDRMEERSIRPDGRTYSPVIEAWLRRRDEKGKALAEVMLKRFLERVEASKKTQKKNLPLYEDAVWEVVNAYNDSADDMIISTI